MSIIKFRRYWSCSLGDRPLLAFLLRLFGKASTGRHEHALVVRVVTVSRTRANQVALSIDRDVTRQTLPKFVHSVLLLKILATPYASTYPYAYDANDDDNYHDDPLPMS